MELKECINYLLTNAQNTVHLQFKTQLQPFDITPAQYMALYFLSNEGSLSPSKLAELCRLDTSTMTGILTRMEKKGLIERQHCTNDRRSVDICITQDGIALMPNILPVIDRCNEEALSCLLPEEQYAFKKYLQRILAAQE